MQSNATINLNVFIHHFVLLLLLLLLVVGRYSVVCIATRYGPAGPGIASRWKEILRIRPDRPLGQPSLLYNGYRVSFQGVKRPGRGVDLRTPSSAEVKERVKLYLYFPSGTTWPVPGWNLPFLSAYTCVCSLSYSACKSHALHHIIISGLFGSTIVFYITS